MWPGSDDFKRNLNVFANTVVKLFRGKYSNHYD